MHPTSCKTVEEWFGGYDKDVRMCTNAAELIKHLWDVVDYSDGAPALQLPF